MKQHTAIRALVRKNDQTLLLRRANGRESILGKFELPGGKIDYNEQPEDTLKRYLERDTGLIPKTVQLFDVVTYVDHDKREIQYVFIVYLVGVDGYDVNLSQNYDKSIWQTKSKMSHRDTTESTQILLGLINESNISDTSVNSYISEDSKSLDAILYMDGGSRGNPGHSASAYVIEDITGSVIEKGGEYIGITTSYQAEYKGLLLALERSLELGYKNIECRLDNLMVVNQMKGIYSVKNRELWPINERVLDLVSQFEHVEFKHVRREFNSIADQEVNRILDQHKNNKMVQ